MSAHALGSDARASRLSLSDAWSNNFFLFYISFDFFLFRAVCIQTQHHVYIIECQILIIINFSRFPPLDGLMMSIENKRTHTPSLPSSSPVSYWRVYQNIIRLVPIFWRAFLLLKKKGRKGGTFFSRSCSIAPRRSIDDCVNIWPTPSFKEKQQQLFSPPPPLCFFFSSPQGSPRFSSIMIFWNRLWKESPDF